MDKDTFCFAPWFAVRFNQNGSIVPCCQFKPAQKTSNNVEEYRQSDYLKYVKDRLTQGERILECRNCWKKEDSGITSLRKTYQDTFIKNDDIEKTWVKSFMKTDDELIIHADIKTGNLCNFACAMCNPEDSTQIYSRWFKDKGNEFVQDKLLDNSNYFDDIKESFLTNDYNNLHYALNNGVTSIKILGGEPFLDNTLLEILERSDRQEKIRLHFVSNGSIDIVPFMKRTNFKYISITFSLEGIGDIQDYIRKGSKWEEVSKNIIMFKGLCRDHPSKYYASIHHTVQALSVEHLDKLIQWTNENELPISFNVLYEPDYLSLHVLDIDFLKEVAYNIKDMEFIKTVNYLQETDIPNLYKYIINCSTNVSFKDKLYLRDRFKRFIKWYEQDSKLKMKVLMPKLYKEYEC